MTADRRLQPAQVPRHAGRRASSRHIHWFRWDGENLYANGSLYRCRCGVVRAGL